MHGEVGGYGFEFRSKWGESLFEQIFTFDFLKKNSQDSEWQVFNQSDKEQNDVRQHDALIEKTVEVIHTRLDVYGEVFCDADFKLRLINAIKSSQELTSKGRKFSSIKISKSKSDNFSGLIFSKDKNFYNEFAAKLILKRNSLKVRNAKHKEFLFDQLEEATFAELVCAFIKVPTIIRKESDTKRIESILMTSGTVLLSESSADIQLPETYEDETLLVFIGARYQNEVGEYLSQFDSMHCALML